MNVSRTALVASCDPNITQLLEPCLTHEGFCVLVVQQGERIYEVQRAALPDLIVLDADLPDVDSWQLCALIRQNNPVPILMLAGAQNRENVISCLEVGADECIVKPADCREILARINAIFRRVVFAQANSEPAYWPAAQIKVGNVSLDTRAYKVYKNNQELSLRQKEYDLLHTLMSSAGEVISRAELLDRVWGVDWLGDTRTLDVHIRWVREKVEEQPSQPRYIQTVRGVGYRFAAPGEIVLQ